jgi:PRTRC genetic system protein C
MHTRVFKFRNKELTDPNTELSPKQVADFYSEEYPELVNATITGPEIADDKAIYSFNSKVGTKG